jgi:hypothetical protein
MDIQLENDFVRVLVESDPAFREFVAQNWGRVRQAAFVWDLQSLDPEISPLVLYVTRRANRHAKAEDLEIQTDPRKLCAEEHITLEIFTADDDP